MHCTNFIFGVTISCMTSHWILKIKYWESLLLLIWLKKKKVKERSRKKDLKPKGEKEVKMPVLLIGNKEKDKTK